jgi:hypothetical protein
MYRELSTNDVLIKWVEAARVFCRARTSNYGRFTKITHRTYREYADRNPRESKFFGLVVMAQQQMAEHLLKVTPHSGRDALDQALLEYSSFVFEVDACATRLASWCQREGLFNSDEAKALVSDIRDTEQRRRQTLRARRTVAPTTGPLR